MLSLCIPEGIRRYFTSLRDKQRRLSTGKDNRHKQKMVMYVRKKRVSIALDYCKTTNIRLKLRPLHRTNASVMYLH
jgi:hypothetical protein